MSGYLFIYSVFNFGTLGWWLDVISFSFNPKKSHSYIRLEIWWTCLRITVHSPLIYMAPNSNTFGEQSQFLSYKTEHTD